MAAILLPFGAGCAVSAKTHALGHMRAAAAAAQKYDFATVLEELNAARVIQGPTAEVEALRAAMYWRFGMTDLAEAAGPARFAAVEAGTGLRVSDIYAMRPIRRPRPKRAKTRLMVRIFNR